RLPTVTGLAVDSVAPTTGTFHWTAVAGATGYRIDRSTDNSSWTTGVGTTAAGVTSYTATGLSELTHYYFRVVGTAGTTISLYHGNFFLATPDATPPAQWTSADIGAVGGPGAAGANTSNVFSVIGSGADIWGTADAMRYLYQPLVGDGEIVARVASVENTDDWVKAGVMIRESTAAGARNAFMLISRASGAQWQYRSSTGGSSSSVNSAGKAAPYWVKLGRVGNVFTGSVSTDGSAWTVIGTQTITMGASALVGLATTAHNNAEIAKATFDNVTLSNAAPTIATNPAASPATVTGTTTALSVLAADDHGEANLTYAWTVTAAPAGATGAAAPTFSANGTNAAKAATATFYRAGAYTLTLTATDAGGLTVSRTVNVTVSQTLTAITVTPASGAQAAANGGAVQFAAAAVDQFGQPMARTFTWSVTGTGNAVSSSGLFTAGPNAGSYTVTATSGSVGGSAGVTVTAPVVAATVAGRRVFYNNSAYDGGSADPGATDDNAIAPDKQALLPGQASSSANFTNYDKGINGIMIDVAGLPAGAGPTAADFAFLAGVTADPAAWTEVVTPATVAVRRGAGAGGSDRVTVTFADRTLVDRWLRVTVLANAITGLAAADVFYVGNLVADTGNGAVTISDVNQTKFAMVTGDPVTITTPTDWNRNGVLTISDVNIARANVSHTLVALTAPAGAAPDAAAATDLAVAVDRPPAPVVFATARRITGVWDD
ncbi:MAG TPA: hypothetical protein VK986_02190, partial [Tepidisphaeraceae bacterium]|nr:hypothetical protein [Tepidisphaeraceae bacterium]